MSPLFRRELVRGAGVASCDLKDVYVEKLLSLTVAGAGAGSPLQPEPHVLPLPLVLRLLRGPGDQFRRTLHGHAALVPGEGLTARPINWDKEALR